MFTHSINCSSVITRGGANTLSELSYLKIPFISVPLPSSADGHQFKNAMFYQSKNLSFLIKEKDLEKELFGLINSIFKDKSIIDKILSNQRQYSDKNIFINLKTHIEKILNEKN